QRDREGQRTPLYRFNDDMVFADSRLLHAVGWEGEVTDSTYYIDYDSARVYIGVDPARAQIEITAHDAAIVRTIAPCYGRPPDRRGFMLRGLTFLQYAYRGLEVEGHDPEGLSPESAHGKDVVGTTLENCTIAYCSRVGAYLRGDRLTVRHCSVSDTRTEGLYIIGSADVLLEGNVFARNNIENITGYYPAAVKIFNQCYRATCSDNLIIDQPFSNGVWYDVGNVDGVFVNNRVQGVGSARGPGSADQLWPSANGFFFEISKGAVCAGNVFVDCDHGVMVLNSSDVRVCRNTFVNSVACFGRNGRVAAGDRFGWHASTGPPLEARNGHVFTDNLLFAGTGYRRPLLFVWQPPALCAKLSDQIVAACDGNMFVRERAVAPLALWSPAPGERCQASLDSLPAMRRLLPGYALGSRAFDGWDRPLFLNPLLGRYELLGAFPGARGGIPLPAGVGEILGDGGSGVVGADPPVQ
ncbi:MAG TPA: right-handed parallel beta-helix repeat-containing protein, partial [Bacteroidota bacterium]|nr:right-handed parallel beta-helix repeat-containing protein [Bacteroidota bacterium]